MSEGKLLLDGETTYDRYDNLKPPALCSFHKEERICPASAVFGTEENYTEIESYSGSLKQHILICLFLGIEKKKKKVTFVKKKQRVYPERFTAYPVLQ